MTAVAESTASDPPLTDARYPAPRAGLDPDRQRNWFVRLLPVALAHPGLLASALLAALASMLTSVVAPALLGMAINDAFGQRGDAASTLLHRFLPFLGRAQGTASILQTYLLALLAVGLVRALCSGYYRYALYRGAYYIENDLRGILYEHLTLLPFTFFDRVQSGQIISRANSDIRAVQMLLTFAPMMMISWLSFGLALTFMLSVHVGLTFAAVFALPGIFVLGARMRREMFPLSWMTQARLAELSTVVDESIQGVRVVKAFAAEQRQLSLLAKTAARVRWASGELVDLRARFAPMMENVARIGPAFVLLYGGYLVLHGRIAGVGTLVTFNTYMIMLQAPFRVLGFFLSMSQRAEASAQRIFEVLDEPVQIVDAPHAQPLPAAQGGRRIELRDVSFGYAPERPVLVGLNLEVQPGETVALVGRTGSGKSTLARLLPRFYEADQGTVLIDGQDVRATTLTSLRANIGLAIDEPFLFSLSIRDNIAYGKPNASAAEVVAAAQAAQAAAFIEALPDGYETKVGERGYTLSGGQRQRIALARLFLLNPPVLVLDDATSAVDVQVEALILLALQERLRGRTTLLISHREPTLRLADRVLLLIGGQIVASGTHQQLMAAEPRYREALARSEQALAAERERADERSRLATARAAASPTAANGFPDGGNFGGFGP